MAILKLRHPNKSLADDIKACLLNTTIFKGWQKHQELFKLDTSHLETDNVFDVELKAIPGQKITVTPFELSVVVERQVEAQSPPFTISKGWISSSGPEGGVIRFTFKRV